MDNDSSELTPHCALLTFVDIDATSEGGFGGAIANFGVASVHNSTFSDSNVLGPGGGIVNVGTLDVKNCRFSTNFTDNGGGIASSGKLTVENSIFAPLNSARSFAGGGLFVSGDSASVKNSAFSQNVAPRGGGIANFAELELINSTVSDNRAFQNNFGSPGQGGGIFNSGSLTIINSSVSGNEASQGGGIFNLGPLTLSNSFISDNTAEVGGGIYNQGTLFTLGDTIVTGNTPDNIAP